MIYTHSHVDHFGGVQGVVADQEVPILAPVGFLEHAVSENIYAGNAMNRRAVYLYGAVLERGPAGQLGAGLGLTNSTGSIGLLPPTLDITHTGQQETLDGVRLVFQLTPGHRGPGRDELPVARPAGAVPGRERHPQPAQPAHPARGPGARPRGWSRYLTEAINLFADQAEVAFAPHHWPTWGRDQIVRFLSQQRDLYGYLHDQTLRLLNAGYTGIEIAELLQLPPALETAWHTRGSCGSVSHNVKAIYQRYPG